MTPARIRVLIVPDSKYWVTGTIAAAIAEANPRIEATIWSFPVVRRVLDLGCDLNHYFDVVHLLTPDQGPSLVRRLKGKIPLVGTIHHILHWSDVELMTQTDAVMTVCRQWHEELIRRGVATEKLVCIPNGVDPQIFRPLPADERMAARRSIGVSPSDFVVGFTGKASSNPGDRKGTDVFVMALRELARQLPRSRALIVGPGWDRLTTALRRDGIRVHSAGYIHDSSSLPRLYSAMDVYWVTARVEGGPVPLLEAMSCAVPSVSTRVGIAPDAIVSGQSGYLIDSPTALPFVDRTVTLANDDALRERMGNNARTMILTGFDINVTPRRALAAYEIALCRFMSTYGQTWQRPESSITSSALPSKQELESWELLNWQLHLGGMGEWRASLQVWTRALCLGWKHPRSWLPLMFGALPHTLRKILFPIRHRCTRLLACANQQG